MDKTIEKEKEATKENKPSCIRVKEEHINMVWPIVKPYLQKGVDLSGGLVKIDDLYRELKINNMQLWASYKELNGKNAIIGACLTEMVKTPQKLFLRIAFIGGREHVGFDIWINGIEKIEQWAKSEGCEFVETFVRKGLNKKLKPMGYKLTHYRVIKPLTEQIK